MTLNEMIYHRKFCRSFTGVPVDAATIETIKAFPMRPLYLEIKVHWDIVPRNQVKCICPWTTPQLITIYSEETDEGMDFVIMLAFGYPKGDQLRHDLKAFKRKTMEKISDKADPRLEPAGIAPSSTTAMLPDALKEQPYDGAKDMLLVENVDDRGFLKVLFEAVYPELPERKKK